MKNGKCEDPSIIIAKQIKYNGSSIFYWFPCQQMNKGLALVRTSAELVNSAANFPEMQSSCQQDCQWMQFKVNTQDQKTFQSYRGGTKIHQRKILLSPLLTDINRGGVRTWCLSLLRTIFFTSSLCICRDELFMFRERMGIKSQFCLTISNFLQWSH